MTLTNQERRNVNVESTLQTLFNETQTQTDI